MTLTPEQEKLFNLCDIQAAHTILVRVGVDGNSVINEGFPSSKCVLHKYVLSAYHLCHSDHLGQSTWQPQKDKG